MRRLWVALLATTIACTTGALVNTSASAATPMCDSSPHHATLVIAHGDGTSLQHCIGFSGSTISAEQLLAQSGIEYGVISYGGGLGDAVCQVDYEPASYPPTCFANNTPFWEIFVARGGVGWSVSNQGASTLQLYDGDAAGFRYESPNQGPVSPPLPSIHCPLVATPAPSNSAVSPTNSTKPNPAAARISTATPQGSVLAVSESTPSQPTPSLVHTPVVAQLSRSPTPTPISFTLMLAFTLAGVLAGLLAWQLMRPRAKR